jgi:electron transfer flavoprotein alpha subunit
MIAVLIEPDRPQVGAEILGTAARLAAAIGGHVHAVAFGEAPVEGHWEHPARMRSPGSPGFPTPRTWPPPCWSGHEPTHLGMLGPSTSFGREVLGRMAAALGAGLVGDAIGLEIVDRELVAAKPAFSGALVADITCTSDVRLVSVRPGVLPLPTPREHVPDLFSWAITPRSRVRLSYRSVATTTSRYWRAPMW